MTPKLEDLLAISPLSEFWSGTHRWKVAQLNKALYAEMLSDSREYDAMIRCLEITQGHWCAERHWSLFGQRRHTRNVSSLGRNWTQLLALLEWESCQINYVGFPSRVCDKQHSSSAKVAPPRSYLTNPEFDSDEPLVRKVSSSKSQKNQRARSRYILPPSLTNRAAECWLLSFRSRSPPHNYLLLEHTFRHCSGSYVLHYQVPQLLNDLSTDTKDHAQSITTRSLRLPSISAAGGDDRNHKALSAECWRRISMHKSHYLRMRGTMTSRKSHLYRVYFGNTQKKKEPRRFMYALHSDLCAISEEQESYETALTAIEQATSGKVYSVSGLLILTPFLVKAILATHPTLVARLINSADMSMTPRIFLNSVQSLLRGGPTSDIPFNLHRAVEWLMTNVSNDLGCDSDLGSFWRDCNFVTRTTANKFQHVDNEETCVGQSSEVATDEETSPDRYIKPPPKPSRLFLSNGTDEDYDDDFMTFSAALILLERSKAELLARLSKPYETLRLKIQSALVREGLKYNLIQPFKTGDEELYITNALNWISCVASKSWLPPPVPRVSEDLLRGGAQSGAEYFVKLEFKRLFLCPAAPPVPTIAYIGDGGVFFLTFEDGEYRD
eukprot:Blabericola_migrator_1__3384@NODE_19_length_22812_cov_29_182765_g16_i0_p3_GENE_NODE_19_length_22812_cov_29_182765_g16_i0NODE_19_length_22812_cov_29_182765_g16_i0_p3_ORF_typecomplete_len610_score83_16_NODE_19_length_22812_cov_29_182765_g16_i018573686